MVDRNLDILKQGFMKLGHNKPKKEKLVVPCVACKGCYHREGEHIAKYILDGIE